LFGFDVIAFRVCKCVVCVHSRFACFGKLCFLFLWRVVCAHIIFACFNVLFGFRFGLLPFRFKLESFRLVSNWNRLVWFCFVFGDSCLVSRQTIPVNPHR